MSTDLASIEAMAQAARKRLPVAFRNASRDVVVTVRDMPDTALLRGLDIDDPMMLTGLYDGIPLTEKSGFDTAQRPDTIWLFRLPILAEWRDRGNEDLSDLVAHVLVHEMAHHFGWSDDDIAQVDRWWE